MGEEAVKTPGEINKEMAIAKFSNHPKRESVKISLGHMDAIGEKPEKLKEHWEGTVKDFHNKVVFWMRHMDALEVGDADKRSVYFDEAKRELKAMQDGLKGAEEMLELVTYMLEEEKLKKALDKIKG